MTLREIFLRQAERHPSLQPQDIIKLCYQAAFGPEHLISDLSAAKRYFDEEMASLAPTGEMLAEEISPSYCRVNMGAWLREGLPAEWLFRMFLLTAEQGGSRSDSAVEEPFRVADALAQEGAFPFSAEEWRAEKETYLAGGIRPVHHSETYRRREKPAYRVVSARLALLLPLLCRLAALPPKEGAYVIAIDGRAASGKTTAAQALARILGEEAGVVHMDDFFLPLALRTRERLAAPGGNVHYERFIEEVLPHLAKREGFSYRVFSCENMDFGPKRLVPPGKWRIVEGVYSGHPAFGEFADVRVFFDVHPETQLARLARREGEEGVFPFLQKWLPMEEQYFSAYPVAKRADMHIFT